MHILKTTWQRTEREPEIKFHEILQEHQALKSTIPIEMDSDEKMEEHNSQMEAVPNNTPDPVEKPEFDEEGDSSYVARALAAGCIPATKRSNGETEPYTVSTSIATKKHHKVPEKVKLAIQRREKSREETRSGRGRKDKVGDTPIKHLRNRNRKEPEELMSPSVEGFLESKHPNQSKERQLQWILFDQVGASLDAVKSVKHLARVFIDVTEGMLLFLDHVA
jgi:hypothetical protein